MDLSVLSQYLSIVVMGICLCVGYVIKNSLDFIPNKYIPAIMLVLGTTINILMNLNGINAEVILVAKTIDGVYSADPKVDPNAVKYDEITYLDILNKDLKVMDSTAISLCKDNNIQLIVFAMNEKGNMVKAVKGEKVGTLVK